MPNMDNMGPLGGLGQFLNPDDEDDDLDDIDLDSINLDKYFVSKKGDNICDILDSIKEQLVIYNKNSNK